MNADEIRKKYLEFFKEKGHSIIPSASLIPENDPTVLFTTAGMHPLVPYLLGEKHPAGKRLASCQKCIRTGDIDEVGDATHLTFFEMLGNWSLGDYFKKEAIEWSFEFLTDKKWLGLNKNRIAVSVFAGNENVPFDSEAFEIWKSLGIPEKRIAKLQGNWWGPAGETGPCGSDTEMFYWSGDENEVPESFNDDNPLWVEIWNDVFMEFNKTKKDKITKVILIDGMDCLYDENFKINEDLKNALNKYSAQKIIVVNGFADEAQKVAESLGYKSFCLKEEGIKKDNPEFFIKLVEKFGLKTNQLIYVDHLKESVDSAESLGINAFVYSNADETDNFIEKSIYDFIPLKQKNVDTGMGFERVVAVLNGTDIYQTELFLPIIKKIEELSGKKYGDDEETNRAMRIIADHIRAATFIMGDENGILPSNTGQGYVLRRLIRRAVRYAKLIGMNLLFTSTLAKEIIFISKEYYTELKKNEGKIFEEIEKEEKKFATTLEKGLKELKKMYLGLFGCYDSLGREIESPGMDLNGKNLFLLHESYGLPFEISLEELERMEKRWMESDSKQKRILTKQAKTEFKKDFDEELKKHQELSRTASAGVFKGGLADNSEITTKYHTATHLTLAAMRQVLGPETYQKGSNITAERMRFDFNYGDKLTPEQIKKIEDIVNEKISENIPVEMLETPKDEALKMAKVSFDQSKYGDIVKVYKIGDFSIELCGGPHVNATGEIGHFKITKEEAVSAGIRRIKAVIS